MDKILEKLQNNKMKEVVRLLKSQFNENFIACTEEDDPMYDHTLLTQGVKLGISKFCLDNCQNRNAYILIDFIFTKGEDFEEDTKFASTCNFDSINCNFPKHYVNINKVSTIQRKVLTIVGSLMGIILLNNNDALLFNYIRIDDIPSEEELNKLVQISYSKFKFLDK